MQCEHTYKNWNTTATSTDTIATRIGKAVFLRRGRDIVELNSLVSHDILTYQSFLAFFEMSSNNVVDFSQKWPESQRSLIDLTYFEANSIQLSIMQLLKDYVTKKEKW